MDLLRVRRLTVRYPASGDGGSTLALGGVGFDVAAGEAVGVLGESGSGKTSLARALAGLLPAGTEVSGEVELGHGEGRRSLLGLDERAWQALRGDRIGVVYQQPAQSLSPYRRVGRQVADVLKAHRSLPRAAVRARVDALLAQVGLDADVAAAYPHQLSGGQLQRVVLCQALACEPELLLADEPTASLDAEAAARILDLVAGLRRERSLALLWISHDPDVLARVGERLLVLQAGSLVEDGATEQVLTRPRHPFTRQLLACRPGAR